MNTPLVEKGKAMEEKNEMMIVNNNEGLFAENKNEIFCSKNTETDEEKKDLFCALEECDVLLNDCLNQEILIKDVYCEKRDVLDEETGEMKPKFRTILFDVNGQTYASGAYGVYNSLRRIISVFGMPTWENGLKVQVSKRALKNGRQSLTLKIVK